MIKDRQNTYATIISMTLIFLMVSLNSSADSLEFNQELSVYKWVQLESFPDIKVPIYKSQGQEGPGVLLIHGNSSSSRAFHRQIFSDLGRKYKLFFLDLPGHGLASKVSTEIEMPMLEDGNNPAGFPEYQEGVAEAISMVAHDPEVQAKIIIGWSLGGHAAIKTYGLDMLSNIEGVFVFGTAPAIKESPLDNIPFIAMNNINRLTKMPILPGIGLSFNLAPRAGAFRIDSKFSDALPINTPREYKMYPNRGYAYMRAFFDPKESVFFKVPDFILEDGFNRSDDRFRTSLAVLALELDPKDHELPNELEILRRIGSDDLTLGVAVGERDAFINQAYLHELHEKGYLQTLWKNKIHVIKDSGHALQLEQPEAFNALIEEFINDIVHK